jgi:peroxiredoxin Q/BCP
MRIMLNALLTLALLVSGTAIAAGQWVGSVAPAVKLKDQHGKDFDLASLRGRWVALYFYPKDDTPGCSEEARQFVMAYGQLQAQNVEVVGISTDSVESHRDFATRLGIMFPLLADTEGSAARAFNVLRGFGPLKFAARETFLIDPEGTIVYHYPDVNTQEHAAQVLADVQRLKAAK